MDWANWERQGFPARRVQDQIQAISNEKNTLHTRMTLLASLKDSLNDYNLETEPGAKKVKWQGGRKGLTCLMHMTWDPKQQGTRSKPRSILGAPQRGNTHSR